MNDYVIFTDSACDLAAKTLAEMGVRYVSLTFSFDGGADLVDRALPASEFYAKMREGGRATTAAVSADVFSAAFAAAAQEGNDVLYIAFSSGLSATYDAARRAMAELAEKFPARRFLAVDSLSASAGQGLLLTLAVRKKQEGADIDALVRFVEDTRLRICHWFTVNDLAYLKRGGRFGKTAAFVGNVLGIKPVLHIDEAGRLTKMFKVRGRKNAIVALADKLGECIADKESTVYISHGDCAADAELLQTLLLERYGIGVELVTDIGPVIGAHAGPGALALFFVGKER